MGDGAIDAFGIADRFLRVQVLERTASSEAPPATPADGAPNTLSRHFRLPTAGGGVFLHGVVLWGDLR